MFLHQENLSMSQNIENVVIVGGGTAGWMTAAYLSKTLKKNVNITLVESSNITTVGVGEATFSTIKLFFDYLGLAEQDWMPKCNATYKMAIKFVNWNQEGESFYHPFQRYDAVDGFDMSEWWLKMKQGEEAFDYSCFLIPMMCDNKQSPRYLNGLVFDNKAQELYSSDSKGDGGVLANFQAQYPYAYHFDANLLARFLKDYAMAKGVKQVVDDVVSVDLAPESGNIQRIHIKENSSIEGDLFIDCTGFRGLLINETLGEPFIPFAESLLCNSAIAMQIPTDIEKDGINPFTSATALSSGWVWDIPLYGRKGTGYVYSNLFISKEEAEVEFRQHLGPASDNLNAKHINMRIGRNRNSWTKNCVAIGLASGFVEPLESTGIFFIQHGIEELVSHFPDKSFNEDLRSSYNTAIANCIDGVRDFLTLHFYASNRNDTPFWKATKDVVISEELQEKLQLWKTRLPNNKNINQNYHGFESYSYSVMMLGLKYQPDRSLPVLDLLDSSNAKAEFRAIRSKATHLSNTLPSQYEYLTHVVKSQEQSEYLAEFSAKAPELVVK
jgi:tryptophan 6-halogenase